MVRTQIQLSEGQARALREAAVREHISMAEVIRRAIDLWLKSSDLVPMEERRRRAMSVLGRFRSGRADISERHDDYLDEAYEG